MSAPQTVVNESPEESDLCVIILRQDKVRTILQGLRAACDEYSKHGECDERTEEVQCSSAPGAACEDRQRELAMIDEWQAAAAAINMQTGVVYP
ncbi:hypothetical protein [Microbispora sp. NBRC 16548]|uniref:hypothetical protein n=1 Tax=Microbispora sp. NBRC 16548 TaxID=3030994 RepID=UPI0016229899|nr:hypothetical protein [Microbispora sp. NBRC 16548]GLX06748.1 hypothetical protein Misp03_36750 [Microbispora sp. NBRC 16548]